MQLLPTLLVVLTCCWLTRRRDRIAAAADGEALLQRWPQPQFLRRTVGLFLRESRLGFVCPSRATWLWILMMGNLAMEDWLLPDEASFYRWIEPMRDSVGANAPSPAGPEV